MAEPDWADEQASWIVGKFFTRYGFATSAFCDLEALIADELRVAYARGHADAQPNPQGARIAELERELANAKTLWARSIEQVGEEQTERRRVAAERDRLRRALMRTLDCLEQNVDDPDTVALEIVREALAGISQNAPETDIPPGRVAPGDMTPTEHAAERAQAQRDVIAAAGTALLAWAKNEGIFPAMSALKQRYDALDALESGGGE